MSAPEQVLQGGTGQDGDARAYRSDVIDGVSRWLGVHYGIRKDPQNRFSPVAAPAAPLQSAPAVFPQLPGGLDWLLGPALAELSQDEDAFQLNIWAPAGAAEAPVAVFLPGGAFVSGAGTVRWYDAARLAREGGAVVVTVNYRLGALAFAGDPAAGSNLAMGDLLQALAWVRSNIAAFGGNPENTTLIGQSAGAFYAFALSQLPQARGLFRRTALLSLAYQPPLGPQEFAERHAVLSTALGQAQPADAPLAELLRAQAEVGKAWAGRGLGLMPPADELVPADLFDPQAAARRLHVAELLLTTTQDEAAAFVGHLPEQAFPEEALRGFLAGHFQDPAAVAERLAQALPGSSAQVRMAEAMTLFQFRTYARELAAAAEAAGVGVQAARFAVRSPLPGAGSAHCFELPFLFGQRDTWADAPMLAGVDPEAFETAGSALRRLLLGFVADGQAQAADGQPVPAPRAHPGRIYTVTETGAGFSPDDDGIRAVR